MTKFITTILLLVFTFIGFSQSPPINYTVRNDLVNLISKKDNDGHLYRDLGRYTYSYPNGSYIKVHAYIWKRFNRTGYYTNLKYEYILTAVSESYNGNRVAQTWLYNNRVFFNGQEVTRHQFPYGMTTYVDTRPTAIYSWYTNDVEIPSFFMSWGSAVYENR